MPMLDSRRNVHHITGGERLYGLCLLYTSYIEAEAVYTGDPYDDWEKFINTLSVKLSYREKTLEKMCIRDRLRALNMTRTNM